MGAAAMKLRPRRTSGLSAKCRLARWAPVTERDGKRFGHMHWRYRVLSRLMPLLATIVIAVTAVGAHAQTCNDAKANTLFVRAAKQVQSTKSGKSSRKLEAFESARQNLNCILENYSCSQLAVQLASGQSIGEISLSDVERRIEIERRRISTQKTRFCTTLIDELENDADDATVETIARRLVRERDFECAQYFVATLEDRKRKNLRQQIARAQARSLLKKERCGSCYSPPHDEVLAEGIEAVCAEAMNKDD